MNIIIMNIIIMVSAIFCIGKNGEFGMYDGTMPWSHKESDLPYFRRMTMGGICIAGRKTADALPPLQGREIIKVSRSAEDAYPDIRSAIDAARKIAPHEKMIFIIGGSALLVSAIQHIDVIYMTKLARGYPNAEIYIDYEKLLSGFTLTAETKFKNGSYFKYEL